MQQSVALARRKGAIIGARIAAAGFVLSVCVFFNELVIQSWPGITQTAAHQTGNIIGWVILQTFLALILSGVLLLPLLAICGGMGALMGWMIGLTHQSKR